MDSDAGWSSSVARWAHNPEVVGSNPAPATNSKIGLLQLWWAQRTIQSSGYLKFLKRYELVTTKILESAIAAPAYMGESNPAAAIGIPIAL